MHLTPSSSNAILSSRASILESQETRQLLRASDKYHRRINVNLAKNDIIVHVQLRFNNKKDKITYKKTSRMRVKDLFYRRVI